MQDSEIILTALVWGTVLAVFLHIRNARRRELADQTARNQDHKP